jgi:hypothetical protein
LAIVRNLVSKSAFNASANLPFALRIDDFALAMQDV